jgi:predicted alpha/beta hydrolase
MARAHAKASGQAIEVSAYIGRGDQFAEALTTYATTYADQVERDYDAFIKACRSGTLEAARTKTWRRISACDRWLLIADRRLP